MTGQEFDSIWGKALSGGESVDEAAQRFKEGQAGGQSSGNLAANAVQARTAAPPGQANAPEPAPPPSGAAPPPAGLPNSRDRVSEKVKGLLSRKPVQSGLA